MSESPEWCGTREDVRSVGNRVAEVGLEYFCPDYVSKNGVSVTERNKPFPLDDDIDPETHNVLKRCMRVGRAAWLLWKEIILLFKVCTPQC